MTSKSLEQNIAIANAAPPLPAENRISLNGTWTFRPNGSQATHPITVPSHWTHGVAWGYPEAWHSVTAATYEREVTLPRLGHGESLWLRFEAVMLKARVFADETLVGEHAGGFTPFECDITAWAGLLVRLRVEVEGAASAYGAEGVEHPVSYPANIEEERLPGGIWQPVWVVVRPSVYLQNHWIRASVREQQVSVEFTLAHRESESRTVRVRFQGREPLEFTLLQETTSLLPGAATLCRAHAPLGTLPLWSPAQPTLLHGMLLVEDADTGETLLAQPVRFGLRSFRIEGRDFLLNEKPIHLLGGSFVRHRISPHTWRRDYLTKLFTLYRDLGINTLRTHGAICPSVVLEVADEVGILIQNQSSLWSNVVFGYVAAGERLLGNARAEFRDWFIRDRNHPSVVIWDVENEQLRILPTSRPMVEALVDCLRGIGTDLPIVASGGSASPVGDAFHEHCGCNAMAVIRAWSSGGLAKPLIHGEWWPDQTRARSRTYLFDGMAGETRVPQQIQKAADVWRSAGYLYAKEFVGNRLWGVSGTTSFSFEPLLFEPILDPSEKLDLPACAEEPVTFTQPDHSNSTGLHEIRRPFVNPGWVPTKPEVRFNSEFEPFFREALHPFLVGFREESRHLTIEGRLRRTLVAVNDFEHPVSGEITLSAAGCVLFRRKLRVEQGRFWSEWVDVALPKSVSFETSIPITVNWNLGSAGSGKRRIVDLLPTSAPARQGATSNRSITASGILPGTARWLQQHYSDVAFTDQPPTSGVWLLGARANPNAEAVKTFLKAGGQLLVLRQERPPGFLPPLLGFTSGLRSLRSDQMGWGFDDPGRTHAKLEEAPVLDLTHPLLAGLTLTPTPQCPLGAILHWNALDERVADDAYVLPPADKSPGIGHVQAIVGGSQISEFTLGEIEIGAGRVLLCQLHIEANLEETQQAGQILHNMLQRTGHRQSQNEAFAFVGQTIPTALLEALPPASRPKEASLWIFHTADLANAMLDLENPSSEIGRYTRSGGTLLVLPPLDGDFLTGLTQNPEPSALPILSVPNMGEPLLAGLSTSFAESLYRAPSTAPILPVSEGWENRIPVFSVAKTSPRAGLEISGPIGSFWSRKSFGAGAAHICHAHFGGNPLRYQNLLTRLLLNHGVAVAFPEIHPPRITRITVYRTRKPLPLDGDLGKWSNDEPDYNIAPWSHAEFATLTPCANPAQLALADLYLRRRCGAIGCALWDEEALYVCIAGATPAISPLPKTGMIWEYSGGVLQIGQHQLLFARDTSGESHWLVAGAGTAGSPEEHLRLGLKELETPPIHPEFQKLNTDPTVALKFQQFELAIPWEFLRRPAPRPGEEIPLAFKYLVCAETGGQKIGDLVAPHTMQSKGGEPFVATFAENFRATR